MRRIGPRVSSDSLVPCPIANRETEPAPQALAPASRVATLISAPLLIYSGPERTRRRLSQLPGLSIDRSHV